MPEWNEQKENHGSDYGFRACRPLRSRLITIPALGNVITLDAKKTFQTMSGWEATAWAGQEEAYFANYGGRLLDIAVYDLGINRLCVEVCAGVENTEH